MASKDELRAEIKALRLVGGMMSNVCFNLSQKRNALSESDCKILKDLYRDWDEIKRSEQ